MIAPLRFAESLDRRNVIEAASSSAMARLGMLPW
jgi:hypothetical protein